MNTKNIALATILIASMTAVCLFAGVTNQPFDGEVFDGSCGEGLTWSFDTVTGELTISGTGHMTDYISYTSPFHTHREVIKEVVIADGVTSIGDNAFANCKALETLSIPDSVTSFGTMAFAGCTALETLSIPDSVTSFGTMAFAGCTALETLSIPGEASIGSGAFQLCRALETISIPNVTNIGQDAFRYCDSLETLSIPNSVETLGRAAFGECTSLSKITIGNNVGQLPMELFLGCTALTSVTIPDNVTAIGNSAFKGCSSLNMVWISNSSVTVSTDAFALSPGGASGNAITVLFSSQSSGELNTAMQNKLNAGDSESIVSFMPAYEVSYMVAGHSDVATPASILEQPEVDVTPEIPSVNGYAISSISVNGGAVQSDPDTGVFTMPDGDVVVTITYTASAGPYEVVIPQNIPGYAVSNILVNDVVGDLAAVPNGSVVSFTVVPEAGYGGTITVGGTTITSVGSTYTFTVIGEVVIMFDGATLGRYDVTMPTGPEYTIATDDVLTNLQTGAVIEFTVEVNGGYGGTPIVTATGAEVDLDEETGIYTITVANSNVSVNITGILPATHTVTAVNGTGYTIVVDGEVDLAAVADGSSISFTLTIAAGYGGTPEVMAGGEILTAVGGLYTISNITDDVIVTVTGITPEGAAGPDTEGDGSGSNDGMYSIAAIAAILVALLLIVLFFNGRRM